MKERPTGSSSSLTDDATRNGNHAKEMSERVSMRK